MGSFDIEEALESPAFYILGGGGVLMELAGFIITRRTGMAAFPIWQLIVLILGTLAAAVWFSSD